MCRLLPLWRSILEEIGCRPHFIIIFRNPLEVAASLHARNGTPQTKSLMWWLDHVLESERETRSGTRAFVSFSQLMNEWRGALELVADRLQIQWPRTFEDARTEVEDFLDARLKHHNILQTNVAPETDVPEFVTAIHDALKQAAATGHTCVDVFDNVAESLRNQMLSFSSTALRDDVGARVLALRNALDWVSEQDKIIADREAQIEFLRTSRSWRWTAPLRRIWTLFGGAF